MIPPNYCTHCKKTFVSMCIEDDFCPACVKRVRKELSPTQGKILRAVLRAPNGHRRIGGDRVAHYLSSARSLVRRGLLNEFESSHFAITGDGREVAAQ